YILATLLISAILIDYPTPFLFFVTLPSASTMRFTSAAVVLATVGILAITLTAARPSPGNQSTERPVDLQRRGFFDFMKSPESILQDRKDKLKELTEEKGKLISEIKSLENENKSSKTKDEK
ncbi:hypothetical protein H4R33_007104, partial [Dimargaris cristalligena]